MRKEELERIAKEEGLSVEATTSDRTGYPRNERWALTGFETWKQAEEVSSKYGLTLFWGYQKAGWHHWYCGSNFAFEPMTCQEAFSDDRYDVYDSFEEYRKQEEEYMNEEIEDANSCEDWTKEEREKEVEEIRNRYEEKFRNIEQYHEEGYDLLFENGDYINSYPKEMVAYSYDNSYYAVVAVAFD